jgi:hypothetical protein
MYNISIQFTAEFRERSIFSDKKELRFGIECDFKHVA